MDTQSEIPEFSREDKRETVAFYDFQKHKEVVGKLKAVNKGVYGDQYIITTNSGEVIVGTYDVLSGKIGKEDEGKWIKIVFVGEQKSTKTGRHYKDFEVYIK